MAMWHGHRTTPETLIARQLPTGKISSIFRAFTPKADLSTSGQRCPQTNTISAIISITDGTADHASVAIETMSGLTIELLRLYGTVS